VVLAVVLIETLTGAGLRAAPAHGALEAAAAFATDLHLTIEPPARST
jgi:hypothetical protein